MKRGRSLARRPIVIAGLVLVAFWWLVSPVKYISLPSENGTREEVAASVSRYFQTHTRRNLLLNPAALEASLMQASMHVTEVEVQHNPLLSRVTIRVASDRPALRWQTEGVQYTLSRSGIALYQTPLKGEEDLPLVLDKASLPVQLKSRVVPSDFVTYVQALQTAASGHKLSIRERSVRDSIRELEIKLTKRSYRIRLSTQGRAEEQMSAYSRLTRHFTQRSSHPASYIDLRIPNRAYWR
jgi:cell division septal protein FtsQ